MWNFQGSFFETLKFLRGNTILWISRCRGVKSFDSSGISKSKIKSLKIPAERDIKKVLKNVTSTSPVCYFSGIAQYYFSKHIATGLATLTYF